jgi:hypothetical protein
MKFLKEKEIPSADELYQISIKCQDDIVKDILNGVEEHIDKRILEEAENGATDYTIDLNDIRTYCVNLLLDKLKIIASKYEAKKYKILITDSGNDYWSEIHFRVCWSKILPPDGLCLRGSEILYETPNKE